MKRIISIQDISCLGKCSNTVALPIISACGVECTIIPTAILSTQSVIEGFTFNDFTDSILPVFNHWKKNSYKFDAVCTGYLGSIRQIEIIEKIFEELGDNTLKFVDPVMGDEGALYNGFSSDFAEEIKKLCSKADILTPNLTEAAALLGLEYKTDYDRVYINSIISELLKAGAKSAIITGVSFDNKIGIIGYDGIKNESFEYFRDKINGKFHGTGDIFAACCLGKLMQGKSLKEAAAAAVDFTVHSIEETLADEERIKYGVNFENALPDLLQF